MNKVLLVAFVALLLSTSAWGKRFANQYCEFQLPGGWQCELEGSEYVCQSLSKDRIKEAIIILAAKKRGEQDSLPQYQAYLKNTKTFLLPGGKTQVSEPKYTKLNPINDHRWVDSLHLASEVPGFYTRYLATVKEDLGVAVTLSVAKDHYATYQPIFDKIVASLRVFRQKNVDLSELKLKSKDSNLLDDTTFIPDSTDKYDIGKRGKKRGGFLGMDEGTSMLLLIALAVVGFIIYQKKKKKKK